MAFGNATFSDIGTAVSDPGGLLVSLAEGE